MRSNSTVGAEWHWGSPALCAARWAPLSSLEWRPQSSRLARARALRLASPVQPNEQSLAFRTPTDRRPSLGTCPDRCGSTTGRQASLGSRARRSRARAGLPGPQRPPFGPSVTGVTTGTRGRSEDHRSRPRRSLVISASSPEGLPTRSQAKIDRVAVVSALRLAPPRPDRQLRQLVVRVRQHRDGLDPSVMEHLGDVPSTARFRVRSLLPRRRSASYRSSWSDGMTSYRCPPRWRSLPEHEVRASGFSIRTVRSSMPHPPRPHSPRRIVQLHRTAATASPHSDLERAERLLPPARVRERVTPTKEVLARPRRSLRGRSGSRRSTTGSATSVSQSSVSGPC